MREKLVEFCQYTYRFNSEGDQSFLMDEHCRRFPMSFIVAEWYYLLAYILFFVCVYVALVDVSTWACETLKEKTR